MIIPVHGITLGQNKRKVGDPASRLVGFSVLHKYTGQVQPGSSLEQELYPDVILSCTIVGKDASAF